MFYQVIPFQFHMDALQLLLHITFIYSTHLLFWEVMDWKLLNKIHCKRLLWIIFLNLKLALKYLFTIGSRVEGKNKPYIILNLYNKVL